MIRKLPVVIFALTLVLIMAAPVFAQPPNFGPAIYADGKEWGTKGLSQLPPPNGHNEQSFDKLILFNTQEMPVAEAAPGNPSYNGGRWRTFTATWKIDPPTTDVTSYAEIMDHIEMGNLEIAPAGGYFECPLLPVKNK